jgi:hypothetical protein
MDTQPTFIEGTISHGTLRPQDLIPAFMDALCYLDRKQYLEMVIELGEIGCPIGIAVVASGYVEGIDATDDHPWWDGEDASYLLNETLYDSLNGLAQDGFYFGSHPGDGSDFGFWQHEEEE